MQEDILFGIYACTMRVKGLSGALPAAGRKIPYSRICRSGRSRNCHAISALPGGASRDLSLLTPPGHFDNGDPFAWRDE